MNLYIHGEDVTLFEEVRKAMEAVASTYKLKLRTVTPHPMPQSGMADRMGDCSTTGDIRIVLRCTVNGEWCDAPLSPKEVWDTAAHELAHLKHFNHGVAFQEFEEEMREALQNRQTNHMDKVMDRLVKLQASRNSEATLGNAEAAEAFASAINRMLIEYELNPSDIDYARATDKDPVIEMPVNLGVYKIRTQKTRIAWQESLAGIVARAHMCTFLLRAGSNQIWFVGTKSHATVAEYAYGTLVPIIDKLSDKEYYDFLAVCQRQDGNGQRAHGFRPAWLSAFVLRIAERFEEARSQAVKASPSETMSLMRLNGAMMKVKKYVEDKFEGKARHASALNGGARFHVAGRAAGRAAADKIPLGRRGVEGSSGPMRRLTDGK